jgi:phenylacetate-CoA ligase
VIGSPTVTDRVVQEYCRTHALFPSGIRIERQYLSLVDPPEVNLERINAFKPDVVRSYGSYLEALYPFAWSSGRPFHRPKVVLYSSDAVTPAVRRLIVERCGIPLLSTYEAVEAFKIGFECRESRGIHLNVDLYPIRIVNANGETLPPGETGEVVVSNLVNRATVLLNYRLGDLATLLEERCPCGRQLPLLSFPEGRSDEYLNLPDGRVLHPQAVRTVLVAEEDIWQFQVVQRTLTDVLVAIVASAPANAALSRRLTGRLGAVFGPLVRVELVFVDAIDGALSGGKRRAVVCLGQTPAAGRIAYS